MNDKRQSNQQLELAFQGRSEGESPGSSEERVESNMAKDEPDGPADTTKLMEEVTTQWNLGEAYRALSPKYFAELGLPSLVK
jgi:hypothetical protein